MDGLNRRWILPNILNLGLIDQLLQSRGIVDQSNFLNPEYSQLHPPTKLKNIQVAIDRIKLAIQNQEAIGIFGDYDHDGTPAAALLTEGIVECGGKIAETYIPSRAEGYSITEKVIDFLANRKISLLILVDCGVTNKTELDYALSLGIDSIVIDHHVVQIEKFPNQSIVVNPKQADDEYPFKELCACALAFKVIQLLGEQTGKISTNQLKWYLDLVAISTICDMVPLIDENRILVHFGLKVLQKTRRLGLKELFKVAAIDPLTISTYTVGFGIGPRLNAAGRMAKASLAYDLLVSKDEVKAINLAAELNRLNTDRQAELINVTDQAIAQIEANNLAENKIIIVADQDWSDGIVGLVAGRLMEKFHRPTIVLGGLGSDQWKGSARSFGGFHLVEALKKCEKLLIKYGGHAKAAGLTLKKENLSLLFDQLSTQADQLLTAEDLELTLKIEAIIGVDDLNLAIISQFEQFEPFGLGNPRPILMLPSVTVLEMRTIGSLKNHLKFTVLVTDKLKLEAIAFNQANHAGEIVIGQKIDLAGMIDRHTWQGSESVQFKIIAWRDTPFPPIHN